MVLILPLIASYSKALKNIPSVPAMIGITVTLEFLSFFLFSCKVQEVV